jgi:hypothetical protein
MGYRELTAPCRLVSQYAIAQVMTKTWCPK